MFSQIKILFRKNYISFLKYILISFVILMIFSFALEFYNYISSNYNKSVENIKITMVFSNLATDSYLNNVSDSLSKRKEINSLEIVTAEKGKEKFLNNYKEISPELIAINPFPSLINISLKTEYIDTLKIQKLKKELTDFDFVDDIKVNENLIKSLMMMHSQFQQYLTVFISLILFLMFISLFLSYRIDLIFNRKILSDVSKFNFILIVSSFNLLNYLIGLFISILIFLLVWWFFRDEIVWVSLLHFKTIIISSMISLIVFVFTSILAIIFYKDKKFESNS